MMARLGNIKTAEKSSMLFNKADARMRCVLLGPAMDNRDAVRALVAKATKRVFKKAVPARAAGGRASGEARRRKRARKRPLLQSPAGAARPPEPMGRPLRYYR